MKIPSLGFAVILAIASSASRANDEAVAPGGAPSLARASAALPAVPAYPETRRDDLVENRFGVAVADPYRWLEGGGQADADVAAWVARENGASRAYLDALPGRTVLRDRMMALFNHERSGVPKKGGGRYFYIRNSGLQNQSSLYVRDGLDGPERLLIDPNAAPFDGAAALPQWEPSPDGRHLVYAVQENGSDGRTLHILDVESGRLLDDSIAHVRFSNLSWRRDGKGFFYSRFNPPVGRDNALDRLADQRVYYHALGMAQAQDRLIYATPNRPALRHSARVTDDGRWLLISSTQGTDENAELTLVSLADEDAAPRRLVSGFRNSWAFAGSQGDWLYFRTDFEAPLGRIMMLDASDRRRKPIELVAQRVQELSGASLIGNRLILAYLDNGRSLAELVDLNGNRVGAVPMPGFGTAAGFGGHAGDPETFFRFSDFTVPGSVYRLDVDSGKLTLFATPHLPFNPADFQTEQLFFPSKDGTRVQLYLVRRKDVAAAGKPVPTLLYGYGGFNSSLNPGFSPTQLAWVEQGGALAVASLRGGGEFGKAWHEAGRLSRKQNVFDDFIAAAEYLKAQGYTGPDQLAIEGRSNGGLLVGAVVNQRPDLFAAALPAVGVMDMLRFDRFTAGRYWIDDYGDPGREADFRNLLTYSPYHNIAEGKAYPAILVATSVSDDRVVPAHSYKYAAALQHAHIGDKPHLLRVDGGGGHGPGKGVEKVIEEAADMYSFIAYWTGLRITPK